MLNIKQTLQAMRDNGASNDEIKQAYSNYKQTNSLFSQDNPDIVDNTTGAPAKVRALMGNMSPQDQLKTIQRFYPDAIPDGDNFTFINPDTGLKTSANPKGLDWGDVAQDSRAISQTVGGMGGAVIGTPLSIATGNPGPTLMGMGLGDAIGGQAHDLYMNYLGRQDSRSLGEKANSAIIDTGMGIGVPKVLDKAGDILKPKLKGLMSPFKSFKKSKIKSSVTPKSVDQFNTLIDRGFKPEALSVSLQLILFH